jgi:hypothetical protein
MTNINHRDALREIRLAVIDCARKATLIMDEFSEPDHAGRGHICADCAYFTEPEEVGSHLGECDPPQGDDEIDATFTTADIEPACRRFRNSQEK